MMAVCNSTSKRPATSTILPVMLASCSCKRVGFSEFGIQESKERIRLQPWAKRKGQMKEEASKHCTCEIPHWLERGTEHSL